MSFQERISRYGLIGSLLAFDVLLSFVPTIAGAVVNGRSSIAWPGMGAVVIFFGDSSYAECGATLITPSWAITAAHCLALNGQYKFTMSSDYLARDAVYYTPDVLIPNPNYIQGGGTGQPDDIGLMHFASPIPTMPLRIDDDVESPSVGDEVWLIGYGQTVSGPEGSDNNTLRNIGNMTLGSVSASKLSTDGTGPSFGCFGDSGSAWFTTHSDGFPLIVGSMTYLDGNCNTFTYAVPLSYELTFISTHVSDLCLRSTIGPPCDGIFRNEFAVQDQISDL